MVHQPVKPFLLLTSRTVSSHTPQLAQFMRANMPHGVGSGRRALRIDRAPVDVRTVWLVAAVVAVLISPWTVSTTFTLSRVHSLWRHSRQRRRTRQQWLSKVNAVCRQRRGLSTQRRQTCLRPALVTFPSFLEPSPSRTARATRRPLAVAPSHIRP